MLQNLINWFRTLFGLRIPQPAHDDNIPAPTPINPNVPPQPDVPVTPPPEPQKEEGVVTGYRLTTLTRWRACKFKNAAQEALHKKQADLAMKYKAEFYDPVEKEIGVPWYAVAARDMREESFNHKGYLGNGDPWNKRSVHVPAGRGPFDSWKSGAIDALRLEGYDKIKNWDIVSTLIHDEDYNGLGYKKRGLPSPYVYAGTTIQVAGKFVADGKFSSTAWDTQPSTAGLYLALKKYYNIDLREA